MKLFLSFCLVLFFSSTSLSQSTDGVKERIRLSKQETAKAQKAISSTLSFVKKGDWEKLKARIYDESSQTIFAELKQDQEILKRASVFKIEGRKVDFSLYDEEGNLVRTYKGRWVFVALAVFGKRAIELFKYGVDSPDKTKVIAPYLQINLIPTPSGYQIFNYLNFQRIKQEDLGLVHEDSELFFLKP